MSARIYMLLDIVEGKSPDAIQALQSGAGVIISDALEGHLNILILLQAANRPAVAGHMVSILDSLEGMIEDIHLLVTQGNVPALDFS